MEQRGTSLSQLTESSTDISPVQTTMHENSTDNELVDDILKEMNQNQNDTIGQSTDEYEKQMDAQVQHNLTPSNQNELEDYQESTVDTFDENTKVLSEGERLLHEGVQVEQKGFFESFDVIQFVKTILLTMILFVVLTNNYTHSLICKIPYLCSTVNGVMQLNFVGTMVLATVAGLTMATSQLLV